MPQIEEQELVETKELLEDIYVIIVWNDNINTFDHVIECLSKYCEHTIEQAEQCTYIIHFKGKCDVKKGDKEKLTEIYNQLSNAGLTATLEQS